MENEKLVSIIVPIYNVEKYLEECIESILKQTYSNMEVILVDDGSTDNSSKLLEKYRINSLCVIIRQENKGLSAARNTGLEIAKGEYIYFVDSDDYIHYDAVKLLVEKMNETNADFCCYRFYFFNAKKFFLFGRKFGINTLEKKEEIIKDALLGKNIKTTSWAKMYRRSFLANNNLTFEDGIINEDCLFTSISAIYSKKICFLEKPLYYARIRHGSISRTPKRELVTSYFKIYEKIRYVLEQENLFQHNSQYYYASYIKNLLNALVNIALKTNRFSQFMVLFKELNNSNYYNKLYSEKLKYISITYYFIYRISLFPRFFYYLVKLYKLIYTKAY